MDRREALKKLAVGGAIAAGGSMVLSSNAVAQTSSGMPIGGIPGPGVDPGFTTVSDKGGVVITEPSAPVCANGVVSTTAWWRTLSFNLKAPLNKQFQLINPASNARLMSNAINSDGSCNGCTSNIGQVGGRSVLLRRDSSKLKNGDFYEIELRVLWQCSDGKVEAVYKISGTYPGPSRAVNTEYFVNGNQQFP